MSMMVSFVLSFFPRDVLDEILNLIESVSEDFPSYSCIKMIIENRKKIKQPSDLQSLLPHLSEEIHINNIFHIITYTRELK